MTSSGPEEFHYNGCCLLLCLSLGTVTQLTFVHPEIVSIAFLPIVEFEPLFDWQCRMFMFHTLMFAFWSVMVDSYLILSDNVSQKSTAFIAVMVH